MGLIKKTTNTAATKTRLQIVSTKDGEGNYRPNLARYVDRTDEAVDTDGILSIPTSKGDFRNYEVYAPIVDHLIGCTTIITKFNGEFIQLTFEDATTSETYTLEFAIYTQKGDLTSLAESFFQRMVKIDLEEVVRINPYRNEGKNGYTENRFSVRQVVAGEFKSVDHSFEMDEVPKWEKKKVGKKVKWDRTEATNFYLEAFENFCNRVGTPAVVDNSELPI